MSPTVFKYKNYRFFFFSREETRVHIHISSAEGEAKFWIEPTIELAKSYKLSNVQIKDLQRVVEEKKDEICRAWDKHFRR